MKIRWIAPLALVFYACSIINLEDFGYSTFPSERNQKIAFEDNLWVEFEEDVDHIETERAVSVKDPSGAFECSYSWEGRRLVLTPVVPWIRGFRYTLQIEGTFNLKDGRSFKVKRVVPFFIVDEDAPPVLMAFDPADEQIVPFDKVLTLEFSKAMDMDSFEQEFSLSPETETDLSWNSEQTIVTISPKDRWTGKTRYSVSIPDRVTDTFLMPLVEDYSFEFRTFEDLDAPGLDLSAPWNIATNVALRSNTLDEINNDTGIYLEFDSAMNWDDWDDSWSIEPSMDLYTVLVSDTAVALIPEAKWVPEQSYSLTVTTDLMDTEGNNLASELKIDFTCPIPAQKVNRISHSNGNPDVDLSTGTPDSSLPLDLENNPDGEHTITLELDQPITQDMLDDFVSTISISAVFPSTVSSPSLSSLSLLSDTRLQLDYAGFTRPVSGSQLKYYYRLSQDADRDKTINSDGSYVTQDWQVTYVVEPNP